jgi:hypothetical protein
MAAFAKELQDQGQSFTGYSKGGIPNRAFEALFEGVGQAVQGTAHALDQNVQSNIREDVYQGVDAANDAIGVDSGAIVGDAKLGGPSPSQPLPNEISEAKIVLDRISNARNSGALKESHYWGKLETMVKGLRQRYPGYREQIDNIVSDVTGTTPANALRASLLNEMDAESRGMEDSKKYERTFITNNLGDVPEALRLRYEGGEDVFPQIVSEVSSRQRIRNTYEDAKREFDHQANEKKVIIEDVIETGRGEVNALLNRSQADALYVAGANYDEVIKNATAAASDKIISGDERLEIESQLRNLEFAWRQGVEKLIVDPWPTDRGVPGVNSYDKALDQKTKDEMRAQVTSRIASLKDMLLNQQTGLLGLNAAYIEATKSATAAEILKGDDFWKVSAAIQAITGGSEMFNSMALKDPELMSAAIKSTQKLILGKVATGGYDTYTDVITDLQQNKVNDPEAYVATIENSIQLLTDPESPIEMVENAAKTIFSPAGRDFLTKFDEGDRLKVYSSFYSHSATYNFKVLFGTKANDLQEAFDNANINGQQAELIYNAEINQFEYEFTADPSAMDSPFPDMQLQIQAAQDFQIDGGVKELNTYLKLLDPILEVTGEDPAEVTEKLMKTLGIEFETEAVDDNQGVTGDAGEQTLEGIQLASFRDAGGGTDQELLDMIGVAEGADYNTFSGGSDQSLTGMTVGEVRALQANWSSVPGSKSSASGKYQIIQPTMDFLINNGTLDPDEPFDEEAQDRAAMALLRRRGYDQFKAGKLDGDSFLANVAEEWASVPNASGLSAYAGDGLNAATKGGKAIASMIRGGSMSSDVRAVGYGNIPSDEVKDFVKWNPDPIGNHETNLASVDTNLQSVIKRAQEISGVNFVVGSGARDSEQQDKAIELGWSGTKDSKHNHGLAADIWALDEDGQVTFNEKEYKAIQKAMKQAAEELGFEIAWGGDWRTPDIPHFEIKPTAVASN